MARLLVTILTLFIFAACSKNEPVDAEFGTCVSCHDVHLDNNHRMRCTSCHNGDDTIATKLQSHNGIVSHPAHPEQMQKSCAPCHGKIVDKIIHTSHFTLSGLTNTFRHAFGADTTLTSFVETPQNPEPETPLGLADDLLRRRCFKCHLYDSGQKYPSTGHGQGCGGCHLPYYEGTLKSHIFSSPQDAQCLSCHYGNYVGFDYYGRFEHDFNVEYRTPYTTKSDYFRPYGVEYHQLQPDIHKQRGLICIDCHSGSELMDSGPKPSCNGCHDPENLQTQTPPNVSLTGGEYTLTSHSGSPHKIPAMTHPAHQQYGKTVTCQVCHAAWSFTDTGKYFLRLDTDDIESFSALTVQGNFEIEQLLTNNLDFDRSEMPIQMTDSLTGDKSPGIWLKGYLTRRWEEIPLGRDARGRISVMRPTLDYALSWVDEDEEVRFDGIKPTNAGSVITPYTPHTTTSSDLFYQQRIQQFLQKEKLPSDQRNQE